MTDYAIPNPVNSEYSHPPQEARLYLIDSDDFTTPTMSPWAYETGEDISNDDGSIALGFYGGTITTSTGSKDMCDFDFACLPEILEYDSNLPI